MTSLNPHTEQMSQNVPFTPGGQILGAMGGLWVRSLEVILRRGEDGSWLLVASQPVVCGENPALRAAAKLVMKKPKRLSLTQTKLSGVSRR